MSKFSQEIEVQGHIIDSSILTKIFDQIMDLKGEFQVKEIDIGKNIPIRNACYYEGLILKQKYEQKLISQDIYFAAMQRLSGKNAKPFQN